MKVNIGLLLGILFMANIAKGQNRIEQDSLGRWPFFRQLYASMNYIHGDKIYDAVDGYQFGNYISGQRVGLWEVRDNDSNLIGHRVYIDDTTTFEVQYKKDKIFSIIISKSEPSSLINDSKEYTYVVQQEIISFDKKGKIGSWLMWQKPVDTSIKRANIIRLR